MINEKLYNTIID